MDEKTVENIRNYMKDKKILIVDDTTVGKTAIEKMLIQTAVSKKRISTVKNFDDALDFVKRERPNYIITKFMIACEIFEPLLDFHLKVHPNRLDAGFVVISENDSIEVATRIAQTEVDRMILVPYTVTTLQQEFLNAILTKSDPSPYFVEIETIREHLFTDPDLALKHVEKAKNLKSDAVEAYYYEGLIFANSKSLDKARDAFESALELNPTHYRTLSELLKIYIAKKDNRRAYNTGGVLLENYPVNPALIPTLTWLSVACAQYEDVFRYHEAYKKVTRPDTDMKNYLAASLSIYGKKIIQDKYKLGKDLPQDLYKKAINVVETAANLCEGKPLIFASILGTLNQAGEKEKLSKILNIALEQFPHSQEIKILEVVAQSEEIPPAQALKLAVDAIEKGLKAPELYEIVLRKAIELKLSPRIISSHLENAVSAFPEFKESFASILEPS